MESETIASRTDVLRTWGSKTKDPGVMESETGTPEILGVETKDPEVRECDTTGSLETEVLGTRTTKKEVPGVIELKITGSETLGTGELKKEDPRVVEVGMVESETKVQGTWGSKTEGRRVWGPITGDPSTIVPGDGRRVDPGPRITRLSSRDEVRTGELWSTRWGVKTWEREDRTSSGPGELQWFNGSHGTSEATPVRVRTPSE